MPLQCIYPKLDLSGLEDPKISNPFSHQPPLKYTTLPYSYSHVNKLFSEDMYCVFSFTLFLKVTLQKYHKEVFNHAKLHQNYNTSNDVIRLVKEG